MACLIHDLGKANEPFQEMILGLRDPHGNSPLASMLTLTALFSRSEESYPSLGTENFTRDEANPAEAMIPVELL